MRIIACVAVLALGACASESSNADSARGGSAAAAVPADRAGSAAAISNAIAANPAAADSILTANGQTRDSFDQLMFEIAADSALSAQYAAARTR